LSFPLVPTPSQPSTVPLLTTGGSRHLTTPLASQSYFSTHPSPNHRAAGDRSLVTSLPPTPPNHCLPPPVRRLVCHHRCVTTTAPRASSTSIGEWSRDAIARDPSRDRCCKKFSVPLVPLFLAYIICFPCSFCAIRLLSQYSNHTLISRTMFYPTASKVKECTFSCHAVRPYHVPC
jgi:hypothetical protein